MFALAARIALGVHADGLPMPKAIGSTHISWLRRGSTAVPDVAAGTAPENNLYPPACVHYTGDVRHACRIQWERACAVGPIVTAKSGGNRGAAQSFG